jgi:hypothetical protein
MAFALKLEVSWLGVRVGLAYLGDAFSDSNRYRGRIPHFGFCGLVHRGQLLATGTECTNPLRGDCPGAGLCLWRYLPICREFIEVRYTLVGQSEVDVGQPVAPDANRFYQHGVADFPRRRPPQHIANTRLACP